MHPEVPAAFLEDLTELVRKYPGDHEVLLCVGERQLLLGEEYRVSATTDCRTELANLPGLATLAAA